MGRSKIFSAQTRPLIRDSDNGIVRTLDHTVYLAKVRGRTVYCLDRSAKPKTITIDPTEYRFKLALVKRNYDEMLNIIKTSSLVGQSIISYLQKKGYPEIALQFVQDPQTRFELAIECGNLDVAVEMAKQLDRAKLWQRLGSEALAHGNHQIVEMTYQKLRNFDRLSFLYLCTGNNEKLSRMAKIAEHRSDTSSRFQNALYLGDIDSRIQMFKDIDMCMLRPTGELTHANDFADPLAYMTAKAHGMEDECLSSLEASGMSEEQVNLPGMGKPLTPPKLIVPTFTNNWPTKAASHTVFEEALMGQNEGEETAAATNGMINGEPEDLLGETEQNGHLEADEDEDAGGWDMGDDVPVEPEGDFVHVDGAEVGAGSSEAEMWSKTSPIAADHVAGGAYESAMQLLNRQVGAVNFKPLAGRFEEIYLGTRTFLPASAGMPPLINYVRRTVDETDLRRIQPLIVRDLESVRSKEFQEGKKFFQTNKLEDGVRIFKRGLHLLIVNAVSSPQEIVIVSQK